MTEAEALELRAQLEKHYGQRVAPVNEYCDALEAWAPLAVKAGQVTADAVNQVVLAVKKSNLLLRLIYMGEPLRTEQCPKHQGRWSGIPWPSKENRCECMDAGGQLTGWLPVPGCKEYAGVWFDKFGMIKMGDDGHPVKKEDGSYDYIEKDDE